MADGLEWPKQSARNVELRNDPGESVSGYANPQLSHVCSGTDDKRRICINGLVSTNGLWPTYTQECRCECHSRCLQMECDQWDGGSCEC